MGYELNSAQKAPIIDLDGNPIPTASIHGDPEGEPPWNLGAVEVQDDGAGNLQAVGLAPGTSTVQLIQTATGTLAQHDIVVTASPFDWTLGEPVAK